LPTYGSEKEQKLCQEKHLRREFADMKEKVEENLHPRFYRANGTIAYSFQFKIGNNQFRRTRKISTQELNKVI